MQIRKTRAVRGKRLLLLLAAMALAGDSYNPFLYFQF